jgi:hypothetical protein
VDSGWLWTMAAQRPLLLRQLPPPPAHCTFVMRVAVTNTGQMPIFITRPLPQRSKARGLTPEWHLGQESWRRGSGKHDLCSDGSCKGRKIPAVLAGAALAGAALAGAALAGAALVGAALAGAALAGAALAGTALAGSAANYCKFQLRACKYFIYTQPYVITHNMHGEPGQYSTVPMPRLPGQYQIPSKIM